MSYNIDKVRYLKGSLRITWDAVSKFSLRLEKQGIHLPESNFIDAAFQECEVDGEIEIDVPRWCGEGSGRSYDLFKEALSLTTGVANLLIIWEGGDSITGLRVVNGTVEVKNVVQTLEE
jgi:hypothetical protein